MEFWLINNKTKIRLPVPPAEFKIQTGQIINVVNINDFGEYSIKGDEKLDRIEFDTFFPAQTYSFVQYKGFKKPYEYATIIENWKKSKDPIRFLITKTNINKMFFIETFNYGEKAGANGDVYFDIALVEYRSLAEPKKSSNSTNKNNTTTRKSESSKPKTYKVVEGDTLWNIARKFYDDPNKAKDIQSRNGIKDPKNLSIGQVLILP